MAIEARDTKDLELSYGFARAYREVDEAAMLAVVAPGARYHILMPRGYTEDEVPEKVIALEGEYWTVKGEGGVVRLRNSRGLSTLARLVAEPGHEVAALDLESPKALAIVDAGDAGELLDESARAAYRRRLVELEEELVEAEAWNDPERLARTRAESDALRAELARAVGLGQHLSRAVRTGAYSSYLPERARR